MCFSQYTSYAPRPVTEEEGTTAVRPADAPPSRAEMDKNLYGPIPTPPEWAAAQAPTNGHSHDNEHSHTHAEAVQAAPKVAVQAIGSEATGSAAIASVSTQTVEAVVVELANGTKLLICPLD